jgi:DNA-binding IscR family transcriptional regulator
LCEGGENKIHCALHKDYEKPREELISLFSNTTIHELVEKSSNQELIIV